MCASVHDSSTSQDSRQARIAHAVAGLRRQLDAAGIPNRHVSDADLYRVMYTVWWLTCLDNRDPSDADLYRVMYTVWWLTCLDNRDPDNPDEQARTLRMLRESTEQAGAA